MSSLEDAAKWLREKVGVGGVFTKEDLREAFPGVTQIDRRVRDLRKCGWVINTRREDGTLSRAQMRLVKVAGTIPAAQEISPRDRRKAMLAAAYSCALCGAAGGSSYPDAQHVQVSLQVFNPEDGLGLIVCCARCRADAQAIAASGSVGASAMAASAASLPPDDWAAACRIRVARRLGR